MSKRTIVIADPDDAQSEALATLIGDLGLKAVRARAPKEVLSQVDQGIDALFLDLKSPAMRGGHLLAELRRRPVPVPVVVCTEGGRKSDVVFAMRHGCVDWIDKPAERSAVTNALKRVAREVRRRADVAVAQAPAVQTRALVKEIIAKIKQGNMALPEIPSVVHELRRVLSDMTADSEHVLKVLEKDPSLAARIIATANTATYGGRGRITDLKSAITRLGNRTIAGIAQTAAFRGMFAFRTPAFKQVFKAMWQGQLVGACLARELCSEAKLKDPDEVYLAGLLHNAGEPFLLRVFAELFMRQNNQVLSMEDVLNVIREWHTVFGAGLLQNWEMNDTLEYIARHHHDIDAYDASQAGDKTFRMMHVVNIGDRMVELIGPPVYATPPPGPSAEDSFDALKLKPARFDHYRKRAEEIRDELADLS